LAIHRTWSLLAVLALIAVACAGPAATPTPAPTAAPTPAPTAAPTPQPTISSVGEGEGALSVLAWPGYVEDGVAYPGVDWATPFETETGCELTIQGFGTSDEAFGIFSTNPTEFDVISASGDASLRLVRGGFVQPVNVDLVPSYAEVFDSLKNKPYNTVDGVHYGVPHGRGANQMMYRTDTVNPAPTRWEQMFAADSGYDVSVYDAPIYIADAAVVLMDTNPELGIQNPYALDDTQFAAVMALLEQQKPNVKDYWNDYTKQMDAFRNGDANVGTSWQVIANFLQAEDPPVPVEQFKPEEGATGWSDTWMINSKTEHINCAYKFVNYITSAAVNIQIAEWFGEAPGNSLSCALAVSPDHCATFHADDEAFWANVWYWQTPEAQCVDGRTDVVCKDFGDWVEAWQEYKG
jgi:putative spermidine/putrescine transport system substrate-binding protein